MTSEIRTNTLTSRAGLSTVTLTDSGPMFSGITTFVDNSTFSVGTGGTIHAPATNTLNIGVNNTESLRIDSNSNLKVAGIVTATTFYGSGANLTSLPAQATIANNADNRVITGGSGVNLNGEANLTFDGSILAVTGEITPSSHINLASGKKLSMAGDVFKIYHSTNAAIINESGDLLINQNVSNKDIKISTGSGPTERLSITSGGQTKLNISSNGALTEPLVIRNGGSGAGTNVGMVFYNGNESNSGAGALAKIKAIDVDNYDSDLVFETGLKSGWSNTGTTERLRITSAGHLLHGVTADEDTSGSGGLRFINTGDIQIDGDQKALVFRSTNSTAQVQSGIEWWNENGAGVQAKILCDRTAISKAPSDLVFYTNADVDTSANNSEGDITERLRIKSDSSLLHTRSDNVQRYDLEFRNTGGIGDGNYGGIKFTQGATGATGLAAIRIAYAATGQPDIAFETRHGGGNTLTDSFRIHKNGDISIPTVGSKLYTNNSGGNLTIQGGATYPGSAIKFNGGANGGTGIMHFYAGNATSLSERMTLTAAGRLGLGWSSPGATLHVRDTGNSNTDGILYETGSSGTGAKFFFATCDNSDRSKYIQHSAYWTEIGCHQNEGVRFREAVGGGVKFYMNGGAGSYYFAGSNLSDRNLKENIETISTPTIDLIKQVIPKTFNWKIDDNNTPHGGFIAQDMEPLFPKLVSGTDYDESKTDDGDPNDENAGKCNPTGMAFDYNGYTAYLTKAMQELITKVETLEQENIALRARVTNLEGN